MVTVVPGSGLGAENGRSSAYPRQSSVVDEMVWMRAKEESSRRPMLYVLGRLSITFMVLLSGVHEI